GLVGESGSGKTTIGRAIAGLTKVTGGSLTVLGTEMNGVKEKAFRPVRERIGFVFQDPATSFNPLLTIAEAVAEPLIVHGRHKDLARARTRVDDLLESVQLPKAFGDRYPRELGFAALFISHDLAVVDLLADRIAVLYRGQLVEEGTGEQVLGAPQHPYTQRLLASLPVPDPEEQARRRHEWERLRDAE